MRIIRARDILRITSVCLHNVMAHPQRAQTLGGTATFNPTLGLTGRLQLTHAPTSNSLPNTTRGYLNY